MKILITAGANVNQIDCQGQSPLLTACYSDNPRVSVVQDLIAAGANANHCDEGGANCLMRLCCELVTEYDADECNKIQLCDSNK